MFLGRIGFSAFAVFAGFCGRFPPDRMVPAPDFGIRPFFLLPTLAAFIIGFVWPFLWGIFLSFQNPLEVPGVTLSAFIRSALEQKTGDRLHLWDFKKKLKETMALLNMDESYAERDLNVGFSGGEKKKAEILQMLMLEPKLAILDETDSGLDVDAVRTVSEGVRLFRERTHGSLLIITHSTRILEALHVDAAHVMEDGVIVRNGGAELVDEINEKGFGSLKED